MFTLQLITIEGFRGFPQKIQFDLDVPVVLALGPNGTGKSSLVCAIEWCLFGPEVETEAHTGIRERISWESRNRTASECLVEMELTGEGETVVVHRSAPKSGKPDFWFRVGSGPAIREAGKLKALLGGLEIRDFFTAIHLHQESLRGLLLARPGDRKQGFYRLLGLASLLNQTEAIADAKLESRLQAADEDFEKFEAALEGKVQSRQADIQRARQECLSQGLPESDLSKDGVSDLWQRLAAGATKFAETYSIPERGFAAKLPELNAIQTAKRELQKLRASCPVLKDQGQVLAAINTLEGLQGSYQNAAKELVKVKREKQNLPPELRDLLSLTEQMQALEKDLSRKKEKRAEVDAKAAVLSEALQYFETSGLKGRTKCPVCEQEIESVAEIRKHYEKEIQKGIVAPLQEKIKQLQSELKKARDAKAALEDIEAEIERKNNLLSDQRNKIANSLKKVLGPKDDPVALVSSELTELNHKKERLGRQVEEVQQTLSAIEKQIDGIAKVLELIRYQDDLAALSEITKAEPYRRTEKARLELEEFVRAVETLSNSLARTLEEEAEKRLGAVRDSIAKTFEGLTGRSDFPRLAVSPDTKFAAHVEGSGGVADALSVLNQADTNCAALSIFLSLAVAPSTGHKLGFLILDDPSQSLDELHRERLVEIVSKISVSRQLLLSTIDETLCADLERVATKKKLVYRFSQWDAKKGPRIEAA